MSPRQASRNVLLQPAELQPGKVICRPADANSFAELFAIVGTSHTDLAMVRLFEEKELTTVLKHKCSHPIHKLSFSAPFEYASLPLYADVTKLFCQKKETIQHYLTESIYHRIGKINKKDLAKLMLAILKCSTISLHEKTTFFTF